MKKGASVLWISLVTAFVGIAAVVGFSLSEKQKHDLFHKQVEIFQSQTATYEDKVYLPGEDVQASWTFIPIQWETDVVMSATFFFRDDVTGKVYLTGEVRILPAFNRVQYQVSEALTWMPDGERMIVTSYKIPSHLPPSTYTIEICQQFSHDGVTTGWSCYDGPTIQVGGHND